MASQRTAAAPFGHRGEGESENRDALRRAWDESFTGSANNAPLRCCPHCSSEHTVHWGAAHGFPRSRCTSCKHTFNVLTNTPLARLRNKDRWLTYVGTLLEGKSLRKSAAACDVSVSTALRWHRRFLACSAEQRARILGAIVAAYSNAPALTGITDDAGTNLAWGRDLVPVLLSWIL